MMEPFQGAFRSAALWLAMALPASLVAQPTLTKTFAASSIAVGARTTLTFKVSNDTATTMTGVAFTDNLPAGLIVSSPNNINGFCVGGSAGVANGNSGGSTTSLFNTTLVPNSFCTYSIDVTATTAGTKNNVTTAVTSSAGTGGSASATLEVVFPLLPPTISKTFGAATIAVGSTTILSFTVTNPAGNAAALTGVAFTDTLPAGLAVATPNGVAGSCSGTIAAVAGSNAVSLSGATLAATASCSFSVKVSAIAAGMKNNTTGTVNSTAGGPGGTASASITVVPVVTITSLQATPNVLWPPNHAMIPVTLSPTTAGGGGSISCKITSVSSSEPIDPDGDWEITGNLTLTLRAERLATRKGNVTGRVYTITVQCTDGLSSATRTATVLVPHDQGH